MRLPAARALKRIRPGNLSPGYLLFGKQIYWRDRIWKALREASGEAQEGTHICEFDLRQDSMNRVIEEAQARSLLTRRQLLLVQNAQGLFSHRSGGKETVGVLSAYFQDPNPDSILVLEMLDVDLDSLDWREREKAKSRLEALENLCDVVLLPAPDFEEAVELVREAVVERGKMISAAAAQQLVASFDREMGPIQMEIEKLCIYKEKADKIEIDDLNFITTEAAGGIQFSLTEAIGSGKPRQALEALAAIGSQGTYPPLILAEVVRYLRQLIVLRENRVREPQRAANLLWAAKLPAPQIVLPQLVGQARHFSDTGMLQSLKLAYQTELALRSSPPDTNILLERFVLQLIHSLNTERKEPLGEVSKEK